MLEKSIVFICRAHKYRALTKNFVMFMAFLPTLKPGLFHSDLKMLWGANKQMYKIGLILYNEHIL